MRDLTDRVRGELWEHPKLRSQFDEIGKDATGITYEEVLGRWQSPDSVNSQEFQAISQAIKEVLKRMDEDMAVYRRLNEQPMSISAYQLLLSKFFDGGVVFTLNHDLWFERFLTDQRGKRMNVVGLSKCDQIDNLQTDWFPGPMNEPKMQVTPQAKYCHVRHDALNLIKLHGGLNWANEKGTLMIMGDDKETSINSNPIFCKLNRLQDCYLGKAKRIMIFGYGFRDDHVNKTLLEAANRGAEFFVFDVKTYYDWGDHVRMAWTRPRGLSAALFKQLKQYCSLGHRVFSGVNKGGLDSRVQDFLT